MSSPNPEKIVHMFAKKQCSNYNISKTDLSMETQTQ